MENLHQSNISILSSMLNSIEQIKSQAKADDFIISVKIAIIEESIRQAIDYLSTDIKE